MYCKRCGREIKTNAKFCPACGSPVGQTVSGGGNSNTNKKSSSFKKFGIIGGLCVLVIVNLVVIGKVVLKGKTAESVAEKAYRAEVEGDIDTYYKLLAPPYVDYMAGDYGWYSDDEEFKDDLLDNYLSDEQDKVIAACGPDYKVKKVTSYEYQDGSDDSWKDNCEWQMIRDYDYDEDDIKDVKIINVRVRVSGSEGSTTLTATEVCVKLKNKWYVQRGIDI